MTVDSPAACRPAAMSAESEAPVESVTWGAPDDDGTVVEEVTASGAWDVEGVTPVFETATDTRYRFERDADGTCVCEIVEHADCPVTDVRAEHGQLYLTFFAPDVETVRDIVGDLRDRHDGVHLRHLTRSRALEDDDLVLVDRNRLTDRQREVLETAHEEGYFEHPKGANASELAEMLDISLSTFTEHLSLAQSKVLDAVLEER
ncbi:MAG: helix-turn-helix domain-containing protein [Halorhabdus sp.]